MPRVEGRETLVLPATQVWRLLNDPDVLGRSIPGCSGFEAAGDATYRASIAVAVGAVKGTYDGTVTYRDVEPPERCTITIDASGDKGGIAGDGRLELLAVGGGTDVAYEGTFKLSGPVAGMGQRLAPGISRKMIVETLRNLERHGLEASPEPERATVAQRGEPVAAASPAPSPSPFRPFTPSPVQAFAAGLVAGVVLMLIVQIVT